MSSLDAIDGTAPAQGRGIGVRLASLGFLLGLVAVAAWVVVNIVHIFADSWVAPLHLSPNNDKVLQVKIQFNRHQAELARLDAEVIRIDGQIEGTQAALDKLSSVRHNARASMIWEADVNREEAMLASGTLNNLVAQREILAKLTDRQKQRVEEAESNLRGGLISGAELAMEKQRLLEVELNLKKNERQIQTARVASSQRQKATQAFQAGLLDGGTTEKEPAPRAPLNNGQIPALATGQERDIRIELELIKLQTELRSLRGLRVVLMENVRRQRELLAEVQSRPLYRALHDDIYVAFVPYNQLDDVVAGARIIACSVGVFACTDVGRVSEVLAGEVVTQDPWGDLARGQYVILNLSDSTAIQKETLRIRVM